MGTVFISYSHDSPEHSGRVLALAHALIALGIHVELDQFVESPEHGWPHWCAERLQPENADYVLVVCTPTYRDRVQAKAAFDEGRGVYWEGALIHQYIYDGKGNTRFIPVLLSDAPEDSIPLPLRPFTRYRLGAFDLADPGFEALYRRLTGQPEIVRPKPGRRVDLPPRAISATEGLATPPQAQTEAAGSSAHFAAPAPIDIDRIDRYAPKDLIGREAETRLIDEAWAKAAAGEAHPRVLTFVALGGEGKTALVAKWAIGQAARDFPGCEAAFAWSFYSQGTSDRQTASSDLFFAEALTFFGAPPADGVESAHDKGKRLAQVIGAKRALLVLDGVEPLQYAPSSPMAGELKDDGLRALLKGLAQRNRGLCLVTTRVRIRDLDGYAETAPQRDLAPLSNTGGARLLERLGVRGTQAERETLVRDVKGHALTLTIIGSYLRDAFGGDIRQRDRIDLAEADAEKQDGHAFRAMDAYVRWFEGEGDKGARALAMLRLIGLFDRPADAGCLHALWEAPAIEGLTEPLVALSEEQRNLTLKRLAGAKLLTVTRDAGGALVALDAHPVLRDYFAKRLREARPAAWTAAHKRIYEHLVATTPDKQEPTLDNLQPLYQAVAHGCHAGLQQEAFYKVYVGRILRGTGSGGVYSIHKLGAFGADLGAVACFFDSPWRRVSPNLSLSVRAWLLNQAAFGLRAMGRLTEALEPMRAGLDLRVEQANWKNSAVSASNLSELELTLGEVDAALRDGETAVAYADRSGDAFQRMGNRTALADTLHQADRRAEAEARFVEAEAMQAERQPPYPLLYSLQGFRYCDLLLGDAERAAWRRLIPTGNDPSAPPPSALGAFDAVAERARQTLRWAEGAGASLLTFGLDHLTLARAALYRAILRAEPLPVEHGKDALDCLRRASVQDYLPRGLLTRALLRAATQNFDGAREDLDEAFEIAGRGPMRLFLADIFLYRARLFGLMAGRPEKYPWVSPRADLDAARNLIDTCGYGRRREELEDAEAACRRLYGGA